MRPTVRHHTWVRIYLLLASGFLFNNAVAAEMSYEAAEKEAARLMESPEGANYASKFVRDVLKPTYDAMGVCTATPTKAKLSADIILIVDANGRVKRFLFQSQKNAFVQCIATNFRAPNKVTRPPQDSWPIQLHLLNHRPPSTEGLNALSMWPGESEKPKKQKSAPPEDYIVKRTTPESNAKYEKAVAPYIKKARATYPTAKKRYLDGLPKGYRFFVKKRLQDKEGNIEDSFIEVSSIKNGQVTGTIDSQLAAVHDYKTNQRITFAETDVQDWLILRPDGIEESNFVGKYIDSLHLDKRF